MKRGAGPGVQTSTTQAPAQKCGLLTCPECGLQLETLTLRCPRCLATIPLDCSGNCSECGKARG